MPAHGFTLLCFGGVRIVHLFIFLCVFFFILLVFFVCLVSNVAWVFFLDCPYLIVPSVFLYLKSICAGFHYQNEEYYSKTCLNRTPLGLKNVFSLDRYFGLHRFKLHRHLVDGTVMSVMFLVYSGFSLNRFHSIIKQNHCILMYAHLGICGIKFLNRERGYK